MVTTYSVDKSNCMCVDYAELLNPDEDPSIESYLNSAFIEKLSDLKTLIEEDEDYQVIVRTAKMILGWKSASDVESLLQSIDPSLVIHIYRMSLGEGYYKNPAYSKNYSIMRDVAKKCAASTETAFKLQTA
jgi:PRTase ComF-like